MKKSIDWVQAAARNLVEHAVVIDTETTGLGENDTVVELAAIRAFDRSTVFNALILPNSPMHPAAAAIHGICGKTAFRFGRPVGKSIIELTQEVKSSSCTYITAYNLPFDKRLVEQSMHKDPHLIPCELLNFLSMTDTHCIMEL